MLDISIVAIDATARGGFLPHSKGALGISERRVNFEHCGDFQRFSDALMRAVQAAIQDANLKAKQPRGVKGPNALHAQVRRHRRQRGRDDGADQALHEERAGDDEGEEAGGGHSGL